MVPQASSEAAYWEVADFEAEVAELKTRGVVFEEYDNPGFKTFNGIATGGGVKSAWCQGHRGKRPRPGTAAREVITLGGGRIHVQKHQNTRELRASGERG